jgi:phosphoribosylformylglycinamidine synthase
MNTHFDKLDTGMFDWCVEVSFKPGVTDSVGTTSKGAVEDLLHRKFEHFESVYTGKQYRFLAPQLTSEQIQKIGKEYLGNALIENIKVYSYDEWFSQPAIKTPPKITAANTYRIDIFDLNTDDNSLLTLSKQRLLVLNLDEMYAIRDYYSMETTQKQRADAGISHFATDVELEALAQTWSEHCKHKIFNSLIHYTENGRTEVINSLFKTYIKSSTEIIGEQIPWLLSVFKDNAGVIRFNDRINLVYKVETHNSPSALEPYGGALTGIVGVNRDPMGTGLGAALLINVWGYCFGSPFYDKPVPQGLLHPSRIREGVHKGVIDGGNQSGIPYGRGWEYFDERYMGKPLVFCGTIGYLPATINNKPSYEKKANNGDLIVMAGGRIGKDGIHGATFSSEELSKDSPVQAVQIGDPITQKKLYDFLLEARNRGLYTCITDNGAGGLSSSVGEMAESSGGCYLDLTNAPLKYQGLNPWEILISEAQERMTLAVPSEHIDEFRTLAEQRGVEATVLGRFTDTGKFHVVYDGKIVAFLDMEFLHTGNPQLKLDAHWTPPNVSEPEFPEPNDLNTALLSLFGRLNICSNEGKCRQYDHEVKGLTIIKPFVGKYMDVPADATIFRVEYDSQEGIILAEGKCPRYSDIDTYHMTASAIDEAVRRVIGAGGKLGEIAGLDNFCWPDPIQSEKTPDGTYKLAQLVRANKALYDYTIVFSVPCISGKDSMKNDCILSGKKISIPPTVLFSVVGKISDISKAVTMDVKRPGDLVYIVGTTYNELGGSEYYAMMGEFLSGTEYIGKNVPTVRAENAIAAYKAISKVTDLGLVNSIHTPTFGGLGVALAKTAFSGDFGMDIKLDTVIQSGCIRNDQLLFSESNSRFIITIHPDNKKQFENLIKGISFAEVGYTTEERILTIYGFRGKLIIQQPLNALKTAWKKTLLKDIYYGGA